MDLLVTVISMHWASFTFLKTLADITFWIVSVMIAISEGVGWGGGRRGDESRIKGPFFLNFGT